NDTQDSIIGTNPKKSRENDDNDNEISEITKNTNEGDKGDKGDESSNEQVKSQVESPEKSEPKEYDISVITEAYVCQWNGCGKVFRTKLALKAHIPSEHISVDSLRVRVDKLAQFL
ncbi:3506_t:CDS:1, partial [Scutellospora calospora]